MKLTTHISFSGQCEAAFKFYEQALGAKLVFAMTWGASPMADKAPPNWGTKILHATLMVGDVSISGDDQPSTEFVPQGYTLALNTLDISETERVFNALAVNGKVTMPLEETFWAKRFGMVTDQFGIPWMINCEEPK